MTPWGRIVSTAGFLTPLFLLVGAAVHSHIERDQVMGETASPHGIAVWQQLVFSAQQLGREANLPGRNARVYFNDGHDGPSPTIKFVTEGTVSNGNAVGIRLRVTLRDTRTAIGFVATPTFGSGGSEIETGHDVFRAAVTEAGRYCLLDERQEIHGPDFARHFLDLSEHLLRRRFPGVHIS